VSGKNAACGDEQVPTTQHGDSERREEKRPAFAGLEPADARASLW
jgi:hypothetical protein